MEESVAARERRGAKDEPGAKFAGGDAGGDDSAEEEEEGPTPPPLSSSIALGSHALSAPREDPVHSSPCAVRASDVTAVPPR